MSLHSPHNKVIPKTNTIYPIMLNRTGMATKEVVTKHFLLKNAVQHFHIMQIPEIHTEED